MTTSNPQSTGMATDPITAGELRALLAERGDVRVLDVRTGGEFESMHIPGSYNVPLDTLAEHRDDLADLEHPIVLVCQSGARAGRAHEHLTSSSAPALRVLEGGIGAWVAAGGDVVRQGERWALDRQVRGVAGTIVLTAMLVSLAVPAVRWVAAAVGFGLAFSAVTNTCALGMLLAKLPYNRGPRCDIERVVSEMRTHGA